MEELSTHMTSVLENKESGVAFVDLKEIIRTTAITCKILRSESRWWRLDKAMVGSMAYRRAYLQARWRRISRICGT